MGLFTQDDLLSAFPESTQLLALDDDADNEADSGVFDSIMEAAETWIGGYLEQVGIALASVLTNKRLKHLGLRYAEYTLWRRRGHVEKAEAVYDQWIAPGMKWLDRVATGAESLVATPAGASEASAVSEPARTYDPAGRLMT
ncbi:MAG: DUF1320 family protein [Lentisphaerae bacterium]|nr:DUF1320 family protein [Lentisphaerota bacterium]